MFECSDDATNSRIFNVDVFETQSLCIYKRLLFIAQLFPISIFPQFRWPIVRELALTQFDPMMICPPSIATKFCMFKNPPSRIELFLMRRSP